MKFIYYLLLIISAVLQEVKGFRFTLFSALCDLFERLENKKGHSYDKNTQSCNVHSII